MLKTHTSATARAQRNQFTIDVFPHVKKFILKTYPSTGTDKGSVKVEEYTTLGKYVTLALREPAGAENNGQYRDRLTTTITIVLTKKQSQLGPRLHKLMRINTDIDRVFKEHMLTWINAHQECGVPPYTACRLFLEYYKIDESEYSLEAAHRFYQRTKEDLQLVKSAPDIDTKRPRL
jgi:hypothetical protein